MLGRKRERRAEGKEGVELEEGGGGGGGGPVLLHHHHLLGGLANILNEMDAERDRATPATAGPRLSNTLQKKIRGMLQ
jgi:hypothetical protein